MYNKFILDMHTHTLASDHAYGTIREMAQAAAENGVALEVNNSSFLKREGVRLNYRENYRRMLALCKQHHAPIIVNSDAHDPSAVGGFDEARKFLQEQDFPEELILNVAADRLKRFISWQA